MRRSAPAVALAAAVTLMLSACAPQAPESEEPSDDDGSTTGATSPGSDTLTIATTTDVVNYNPLVGNSRSDYWITNFMYPKLLNIDETGMKSAELAVDWGYEDELTGFYEIRDDFTWSDGEPLTAEDVAFTFNAAKRDNPPGLLPGYLAVLDEAEAVSDTRVELHLASPDSTLIEEAGFWGNVVPEHIFSEVGSVAEFANDSDWVGAGPYLLTEVQRGQSYTLERQEDYPLIEGGTPGPARVVYRVYPDQNTQILALQNGDVDVIANTLPPAQVGQLQDAEGITVREVPGLGYTHMVYNMTNPDLADVRVRQALTHAVDYDAIREVVLQGQAVSTGSVPVPPVLTEFADERFTEYVYDIDLTRELLEEAGYTADASGSYGLTFDLIYSLQDAVGGQWASLVADSAAEAGITIELRGMERNTYLEASNAGDYDIYAGNYAITDDPISGMALMFLPDGAINLTYNDDQELTDLIEAARSEIDREAQVELAKQALEIVREEVYDNVMYTQNLYVAHGSDWDGFVVKPSELMSIVSPVSIASAYRVD